MDTPHGEGRARPDGRYALDRVGPYRILGTLDEPGHAEDARRLIGRDVRQGATVVLTLPHTALAGDPGHRVRFRAEAEKSRRLTAPGAAPVVDVSPPDAEPSWVAYDCFPALTLPAALAAHGGPLPEPAVRALGLSLAATLANAHASGLVHAGLSPGTVLFTTAGPRLTGFGLVRAAGPEGTRRTGRPGIVTAYLPPEQRSGERPRPEGDVYAWGAVLAYAATGRTAFDPAAVPRGLRETLVACLSPQPERRPRWADLTRRLSAPAARPDAVPEGVATALVAQAAAHPPDPSPTTAESAAPHPAPQSRPTRRAVAAAAVYGAAGIALGAGGVAGWRSVRGDRRASRTALAVRGTAPAPLWRHELGTETRSAPVLWQGSLVLVAGAASLTAVRLRDGKQSWTREYDWSTSEFTLLGGGLLAVYGGSEFAAVSARTGKIAWVERTYDGSGHPSFLHLLAGDSSTLYFVAEDAQAGAENPVVVAYDVRKRSELWRTPVPGSFASPASAGAGVLRPGALWLSNVGEISFDAPFSYLALDRRDGSRLWKRGYDRARTMAEDPRLTSGDLLVSADAKVVRAHDILSGRESWRYTSENVPYTDLAIHGRTLCFTDAGAVTYALDAHSGELRWRRGSPADPMEEVRNGGTAFSWSGRHVLQLNESELDAFDAVDGSPRWRFAPAGSGEQAGRLSGFVRSALGMAILMNANTLYALPVD